MGNERLEELVEESIRLELNVGELYRIYSEAYPEDNDFWWQLHLEEKSHATLLRAARDSFIKRDKFPVDLVADSIDDLKISNQKVEGLIAQYKDHPPERYEACRIAVELENESGELHYTRFMEREAATSVENVFQQLNRGDKAHEQRIRAHCESIGAEV